MNAARLWRALTILSLACATTAAQPESPHSRPAGPGPMVPLAIAAAAVIILILALRWIIARTRRRP